MLTHRERQERKKNVKSPEFSGAPTWGRLRFLLRRRRSALRRTRATPENGGTPSSFIGTDAPVIYSVACVLGIKSTVFYRALGPSAAENFILAMLKNVGFSMVFALREGKVVKSCIGRFFNINCLTYPQRRPEIANISPTYAQHSLQDGST